MHIQVEKPKKNKTVSRGIKNSSACLKNYSYNIYTDLYSREKQNTYFINTGSSSTINQHQQPAASATQLMSAGSEETPGISINSNNNILQKKDIIENIVLNNYSKDKANIKRDLASCIEKFKAAIASKSEEPALQEVLDEEGRDKFFYRKIFHRYTDGIREDLQLFQEDWPVGNTGGLLADLGLALKRTRLPLFCDGLQFGDIMNQYLLEGSNYVRKREGAQQSKEWSDDLTDMNAKGKAGPSSTTTQLLHVVSSIGTFTDSEVEAMMIALVKFWKKKTKRITGDYHTAAEVWAPYTGYLEAKASENSSVIQEAD